MMHGQKNIKLFHYKMTIKKGYITCRPIYIFDHIPLNSSQNEKCFRQNFRETQNTHFMVSNPFPKIVPPLMRECGKIFCDRTDRTWRYVACALRVWKLRLQTHTQNM